MEDEYPFDVVATMELSLAFEVAKATLVHAQEWARQAIEYACTYLVRSASIGFTSYQIP